MYITILTFRKVTGENLATKILAREITKISKRRESGSNKLMAEAPPFIFFVVQTLAVTKSFDVRQAGDFGG
jgi:hypothetical protein